MPLRSKFTFNSLSPVSESLRGLLVTAVLSLMLLGLSQLSLQGGSLWLRQGTDERGLFADKSASSVGDIVTIVIDESSAMASTVRLRTDSTTDVDNGITSFLFPATASNFGTHNGALPATGFNSTTARDGGGQASNTQSLSGRISVLVIDVLPNGNLILEGVRTIAYADQRFYMVTRGVCRPEDITPDNRVFSSLIAEAQIELIAEGSLQDAQERGWLSRLHSILNPY